MRLIPCLLIVFALAPLASAQRADSLLASADSLTSLQMWGEAETAYRAALEAADIEAGPNGDLTLDVASALAWFLTDGGQFSEAESLLARVAAGREIAADTVAAEALLDVAFVRYRMGAYESAERAARDAFDRVAAGAGESHPLAAQALNQIGLVRFTLADLDPAEALFRRALDLSERARGPVHDDVAAVLGNLAPVLQQRGDVLGARVLFERAYAIDTTLYGPRSLPAATDLDRLAFLHLTQGDYAAALGLYSRALAIETEAGPPDHPRLAGTLHNLGDVLERMDRREDARQTFEQALGIARTSLGDGHAETARNLDRLASLALRRGNLPAADSLARGSLQRFDAALGPDHPATITARETLARVAAFSGNGPLADSLLAVSLGGAERVLGPEHPDVAGLTLRRAWVALRAGEAPQATAHLARSGQILSHHASQIFPALSAAEQVAFAENAGAQQTALTLLAARGSSLARAPYRGVYAWKGIVHEGLRQRAELERAARAGTQETAAAARDLADVRRALAVWRGRAGQVPREAWVARNDSLVSAREAGERALAALSGGAVDPMDAVGAPLDVLLPREALVDYYRVDDTVSWDGQGDPPSRYLAVVSTPQTGAHVVDVGPAAGVDAAVTAWLEAVASESEAGAEMVALRAAAWAPVAAALPAAADRVWVSPDATLARLPWTVLAGERGLVAEISSPRALARLRSRPAPVASAPSAVLVGDVTFGPVGPWRPLEGTWREVRDVGAIARAAGVKTTVLTGRAPTPGVVSRLAEGSTHLHIATHGYVDGSASRSGGRSGPDVAVGAEPDPERTAAHEISRTPLLASGLALAGANDGDGGLLTAEDLVSLDLDGVRLVALSACDTGRGATVAGQGVLGLRASLAASGARAVLLSLWPVDDDATALLMRAFYEALWTAGVAPAEALSAAQQAVRDAGFVAPVYWAGWVLDGEAW